MRSSRLLPKKMILASSPPSSITASVPGSRALTAAAVAYTSCTKIKTAGLGHAQPCRASNHRLHLLAGIFFLDAVQNFAGFSRTLEKCRS